MLRVDLHAARREFLEGQAVPFAQTAQAGAEEVADVIAWLLSDQSSFVSGAAIPVQGGDVARVY